jgi:itaconate CoA-transferase
MDDAPLRTGGGASHATIYPYGPFPAGDGKTVMLGLQNEREWVAFCNDVLKRPELARDERFITNAKRSAARAALRAIVVEAFAKLTAEQVIARLDAAQIANAQVNTMHEVWAHPQLRARNRWRDVATPVGAIRAALPPGVASPRMHAIPALGAHTDAILRELGYDDRWIAQLRANKIV